VAVLVVVVVIGLAVAVVLVVKDRKGSSKPAGASSVATTDQPPTPGPSPTASAKDPATIAAYVDPGVVELTIRRSGVVSQATGIVLTPTGQFLTSNHVVNGADSV
jgi:S1-C subfamily serine protease